MTHSIQNSKSILARALATENIRVEHSPSCSTAMFDVNNRVLVLPVWENMSDSLYDMFVGHEVGHALYTPQCHNKNIQGPWTAEAERIGGNIHASYVQGLINIIEDVRIERKIKEKFPGLRRDFVHGYRELVDRDFFGTKGKDISTLSFPDRLNIHFKCGAAEQIPFSAEEQEIVDAITSVETFDQVVEQSENLFTYLKGKRSHVDPIKMELNPTAGNGSGNNFDSQNSMTVPMTASDQKDNKNGVSGNGNADQGKTDQKNGNSVSSVSAGNGLADPYALPSMTTQTNFDSRKKELAAKNVHRVSYVELPTFELKNVILPYNKTHKLLSDHWNNTMSHSNYMVKLMNNNRKNFATLLNNTKPLVATLVKQFEMKKAADIQKRTSVSRTGKIDADRIFKYKVSDDIFLRYAQVAEGKNHGLVMYIDWSSSMSLGTRDVLNQVIMLSQFCRRMGIPFDVYLFSSQYMVLDGHVKHKDGNFNQINKKVSRKEMGMNKNYDSYDNDSHYSTQFCLIQVLSSEMSSRVYNEALFNLFALGQFVTRPEELFEGIDRNSYYGQSSTLPAYFNQGNTPLDSTILAAMQMVPEFQKKHKVQIVNTIFLTDGDAGDSMFYSGYSNYRVYVTSPLNKKQYIVDNGISSTNKLLQIFRDVTNSTAIGFFIMMRNSRYGCQYYDNSNDKFNATAMRKNGFVDAPQEKLDYGNVVLNHGYDRLFILPSNYDLDDSFDDFNSLDDGATLTKIRNTFNKAVEKRGSSRGFLNRFADVIAVETKR